MCALYNGKLHRMDMEWQEREGKRRIASAHGVKAGRELYLRDREETIFLRSLRTICFYARLYGKPLTH